MRSKKTGLDYPEPTIPPLTELQQCFSALQIGDMAILYIQYEDDLYSIYQHFVTKRTETHVFITHVKQGFAIADGKAHDEDGALIDSWQLLPYTEEIQAAIRHAQLVEKVADVLRNGIRLLTAMSDEQLRAVRAIFEQVESQQPGYPLVTLREKRTLEAERWKVLQGNDANNG